MKTINLSFEDKEFRKLQNCKEEKKITGECENWEDFILKLAGVKEWAK